MNADVQTQAHQSEARSELDPCESPTFHPISLLNDEVAISRDLRKAGLMMLRRIA